MSDRDHWDNVLVQAGPWYGGKEVNGKVSGGRDGS